VTTIKVGDLANPLDGNIPLKTLPVFS